METTNKCKSLITIVLLLAESNVYSQDTISYLNSLNRKQNSLLITSLTGRSLFLGTVPCIWDFKKSGTFDFHFKNNISGYMQVDKFIHLFGAYVASDIFSKELIWAGVNKKKALFLGGTMGLVLFIPKEFFDGFCKDGGFSWGDILADAMGPSFFIGQELLFEEQILKLKSSFSRSEYFKNANGYLGRTLYESYFKDYNGHTYWLSVNLRKIFPNTKIPEWISIAAGYSANGMLGEYENIESYRGVDLPYFQRYRQYLLSFDVDWSKFNVNSKFLRIFLHGLNFIKIPFPTIGLNSLGRFEGYWIYF